MISAIHTKQRRAKLFSQLTFKADEFALGAFKLTNKITGLTFPTKHFLFFNVNLMKNLMKKYKIGAQIYRKTPSHLKDKLATINLGPHNYLKDYLKYFDTLNLLFAMAFYENLSVRILDFKYFDDIYHIGGTSYNVALVAQYVKMKMLELPQNQSLTGMYPHIFTRFNSSEVMTRNLSKTLSAQETFINEFDRFLERIGHNLKLRK